MFRNRRLLKALLVLLAVGISIFCAGCDNRTIAQEHADNAVKQATANVLTDDVDPDAIIRPDALVAAFRQPQLEETYHGRVTAQTDSDGDYQLPGQISNYRLGGICTNPVLVAVTTGVEKAGSHGLYNATVNNMQGLVGSNKSLDDASMAGVNTLRGVYDGRWIFGDHGQLIALAYQDARTNIIVMIDAPNTLTATPQTLMDLAKLAQSNLAQYPPASATAASPTPASPATSISVTATTSSQAASQPSSVSTSASSSSSVPFVPCA